MKEASQNLYEAPSSQRGEAKKTHREKVKKNNNKREIIALSIKLLNRLIDAANASQHIMREIIKCRNQGQRRENERRNE